MNYRIRKATQEDFPAILEMIHELARAENCKRIRWQGLNWNSPAIEMYRKMGVEVDDEWLNCCVEIACQ